MLVSVIMDDDRLGSYCFVLYPQGTSKPLEGRVGGFSFINSFNHERKKHYIEHLSGARYKLVVRGTEIRRRPYILKKEPDGQRASR